MVGSAIVRALHAQGHPHPITAARSELDLLDRAAVAAFLKRERPDVVILAAARVGGINANNRYPAEFMHDNLMIQTNTIAEASAAGVKVFVLLGSSCLYPRECPQPMKEEYLLTGPLEPTNEGYALAKIAGVRLAQFYEREHGMRVVCPMPCNLYGTNDSFDPEMSHVLSALVRRFCDAADRGDETATVWGTGRARREFLHVDDMARATLFLIEHWHSPEIINVGWGEDITIRELAEMIAAKAGFKGSIEWNPAMPDGMPRKLLDVSKISGLGFRPQITLQEGVERTIAEYRALRGTLA